MSSSDLQPLVESFMMQNYASVFVVTAVSYDYLLNIPREVEYIWHRPWTWVSTIYVVVRYIGLCWVLLTGLYGGVYIQDPSNVHQGIATFLLALWEFPIFLYACDLVMILRVYALWQRSKTILAVLLVIYVPQIIITFVLLGLYDNPSTSFSVQSAQLLNFYFCSISFNSNVPPNVPLYDAIPRFVLAAMLLTLATAKTLRDAITIYRATKQWQPNRYMEQFAKDGLVYFIVNVLLHISTLLPEYNTADLFVSSLCYVAVAPLMPRFIISVREMCERDSKGVVRGRGLDSGFGVASGAVVDSETAAVSAIAFVDGPGNASGGEDVGEASGSEAIQMEVLGDDVGHQI